jgi:hypothetical protein
MHRNEDGEDPLPVTAEIGSEGSRYADPTTQVATFTGPDQPNVTPTDAYRGETSVATHSAPIDTMPAGGPTVGPSDGRVHYPSEPPSPASATESQRMGLRPWRTGLMGAAAGAAVALAVARLRNR